MTIGQKTSMKWKTFLKNPERTQEEIDDRNIPITKKENAPTSARSPNHMERTRRSPLRLSKEKPTILLGSIREGGHRSSHCTQEWRQTGKHRESRLTRAETQGRKCPNHCGGRKPKLCLRNCRRMLGVKISRHPGMGWEGAHDMVRFISRGFPRSPQ